MQKKLSHAIMVLERAITLEGIDNPALVEVLRAAKEWERINASLTEGDGYVGE